MFHVTSLINLTAFVRPNLLEEALWRTRVKEWTELSPPAASYAAAH